MIISKRIIVLCLITCLFVSISFSQQKSGHYKFSHKKESEHFIFYWNEGDEVNIKSQECFYKYIVKLFKIKPEKREKITYWKFRTREEIERKTSFFADGFADIHLKKIGSINPWENHELIHILQFNYLKPSIVFFDEGLAVAFQIDPSKNCYTPYMKTKQGNVMPLNEYLRIIIKEGKYINLENILTNNAFRNRTGEGPYIAYAEAGGFTKYLIDTYGLEAFFQLLKVLNIESMKQSYLSLIGLQSLTIKQKIIQVYNLSLEILEKQWLDSLKKGN